jgi:hypothetical protein
MRPAQVRLVVLDSVAFHYRQDFADLSQRTRILNEASLLLMSLADTFQLAVRICIESIHPTLSQEAPRTHSSRRRSRM